MKMKLFMYTDDAPASAESIPEEEELTLVRCSKYEYNVLD
jgi:hypothetical protein